MLRATSLLHSAIAASDHIPFVLGKFDWNARPTGISDYTAYEEWKDTWGFSASQARTLGPYTKPHIANVGLHHWRGTLEYDLTVGAEENVTKFWADTDDNTHRAQIPETSFKDGHTYRVQGKIQIPDTQTNVDGFAIQYEGDFSWVGGFDDTTSGNGYNVAGAGWVSFDFQFTASGVGNLRFMEMSGTATSFIGAGSSTDDLMYIARDLLVTDVNDPYDGTHVYEPLMLARPWGSEYQTTNANAYNWEQQQKLINHVDNGSRLAFINLNTEQTWETATSDFADWMATNYPDLERLHGPVPDDLDAVSDWTPYQKTDGNMTFKNIVDPDRIAAMIAHEFARIKYVRETYGDGTGVFLMVQPSKESTELADPAHYGEALEIAAHSDYSTAMWNTDYVYDKHQNGTTEEQADAEAILTHFKNARRKDLPREPWYIPVKGPNRAAIASGAKFRTDRFLAEMVWRYHREVPFGYDWANKPTVSEGQNEKYIDYDDVKEGDASGAFITSAEESDVETFTASPGTISKDAYRQIIDDVSGRLFPYISSRSSEGAQSYVDDWIANGGDTTSAIEGYLETMIGELLYHDVLPRIDYLIPFVGTLSGGALVPIVDRGGWGNAVNNGFDDTTYDETIGLQGGTGRYIELPYTTSDLGSTGLAGASILSLASDHDAPWGAEDTGTGDRFQLYQLSGNMEGWWGGSQKAATSAVVAPSTVIRRADDDLRLVLGDSDFVKKETTLASIGSPVLTCYYAARNVDGAVSNEYAGTLGVHWMGTIGCTDRKLYRRLHGAVSNFEANVGR